MDTFAGVKYELKQVPVEVLKENDLQPIARSDISSPKRQALLRNIEEHGIKDPIDVALFAGKHIIIEGHGRTMAAAVLGHATIPAKVYYPATQVDMDRLRPAILIADDTKKVMSGAEWVQMIARWDEKYGMLDGFSAPTHALGLYRFLRRHFSLGQGNDYIYNQKIGPDTLSAAKRLVRELKGAGETERLTDLDMDDVRRAFVWIAENGWTRRVVEYCKDPKTSARKLWANYVLHDRPPDERTFRLR
jgi:hypothetical protein